MLLPCGFLPATLEADPVSTVVQAIPTQVPEVTDEGDIEDDMSSMEVDQDLETQNTSLETPEQSTSQSQNPLNPDAPEFMSDQHDLSDTETVISPGPSQARPQRTYPKCLG